MSTVLRRPLALLLVLCLLPLGGAAAAGCGNDEKTSKTEIALRLGLAYGAFKRYVYTPAQEGSFKQGADKRKRSIAKAAVASAFTARMLQKALEEAKQDPEFAQLAKKLTTTIGSMGALTALLKGGDVNLAEITGGLGSLDDIFKSAKDLGIDAAEEEVSAAKLLTQ